MTHLAAEHRAPGPQTAGLFVALAAPVTPQRFLDSTALARHGQRVAVVSTMDELHQMLHRACPDLAVVDPAIVADRQATVQALVRGVRTPLIAVAVRDPGLRAQLLLAGLDDCLPAPYTSEELAARVIAVGRRVYGGETRDSAHLLRLGPFQLDSRARRVHVHGSEVALTAMEFDLLGCFLRHPGEVMSRVRLLAEVWGYASGALETVTVHVRRLRSKVESDPSRPELIQTIWGVGYRLRVNDDRSAAFGHPFEEGSTAHVESPQRSRPSVGNPWLFAAVGGHGVIGGVRRG